MATSDISEDVQTHFTRSVHCSVMDISRKLAGLYKAGEAEKHTSTTRMHFTSGQLGMKMATASAAAL